MVLVNPQQVMSLHIAHKIRSEHHAWTEFPLDAKIHLHRTRAAIIRIEHRGTRAKALPLVQKRADVVGIG